MLGFVLLILYGIPFELHPTFKYYLPHRREARPRNKGSEAQRSMLSPNQSDHSPTAARPRTTGRNKPDHKGEKHFEKDLAARPKVSLRPALPFPRLLLLLPDYVHTPRNTSAISL